MIHLPNYFGDHIYSHRNNILLISHKKARMMEFINDFDDFYHNPHRQCAHPDNYQN